MCEDHSFHHLRGLIFKKSHVNSMEIDVKFRERLLKLKMCLQNYEEGHISLSLRIVFLSRTGILSLQMSQSMIFLTNKGLFQRWRQCNQGLLLWDKYFWYNQYQHHSRKITRFFTRVLPQSYSVIVSIFQKPEHILIY